MLGLIESRMDPIQAKANYSRVCQLLVDKGSDVLRRALHAIHPPSTLAAVLSANKRTLSRIRYSVINPTQWSLLFPATGLPDSNNFDITLLTILLRNICGLPSPAAGWNVMPPASDTSISADILRIKIFRNEIYGHVPNAHLDDTKFETLWQEISKPLVKLGIPQQDIDELKKAPLTPEEESYVEKLKEWKELEDDLFTKLNDIQGEFAQLRMVVKNVYPSQTDRLAKFDFTAKIKNLCEKFQHGTRQWFFHKLSRWFRDVESSVMILTAGPGVGKSVLSGKVCELCQESGHLAAYHFCDFRTSDYRDPHRILQSLSSQMCDNVEGFRDKLTEILRREHSRESLSDAFRVLMNDPLHALDRHEPMLIVVDALDESKTSIKSEFLDLVSCEFSQLPKWVKIFISSRPELQVRKKLEHLNPLEIFPDDFQHNLDLRQFIECCLGNLSESSMESLISKCEGSFLYAYYLVNELKQKDLGIEPDLNYYIPKGISGFYEKQFERLKTDLQRYKQVTGVSIFNSFVNVVAASREPLPFSIVFTCMGLSGKEFELRQTIIGIMSEILPIYDDCLTVYHKSLWDWLTLNGYEEHSYSADVTDGNKRLWHACKNVYRDIDSLSSVSDFQISRQNRYALENGGKYFVNIGETEDFRLLVNVKVNFLKFYHDLPNILKLRSYLLNILHIYKSKHPDHDYCSLSQLYTVCIILGNSWSSSEEMKCYLYLQQLANGHIGFFQNAITCKNTARDVLEETNKVWLEEMTNESNSTLKIISNAVFGVGGYDTAISSPDNKLLVCCQGKMAEVFKLPSLEIIFQLDVSTRSHSLRFTVFSPDSSYFLHNSIQTCVSIKKQKEVAFIPHGPAEIRCCSFSSCGTKFVTVEKELIKVWDVRKKEVLVENKLECLRDYVAFSSCNSYIFTCYRDFDLSYLLESTTLKKWEIKSINVDTSLSYNDCVQILSPPADASDRRCNIREAERYELPSGEKLLVTNKYCSKPFTWKGRKCVMISTNEALSLLIFDFINQEIVDRFQVSCLPSYETINYISNLGENNFLICLDFNFVFVLSLESSSESCVFPFIDKAYPMFCTSSPDNLYIAYSYGYPILTIMSVKNGRTLQTVVPKQKPIACWWSCWFLWVLCDGEVVVKYPYDPKHTKVLGNGVVECSLNRKGLVLKFREGVLVTRLGDNRKIFISKICNQEFSARQILDSEFNNSNTDLTVAISSDGCAVLLYDKFNSHYELWEIECKERWELRSTGALDGHIWHSCLTGTKNFRSSLWITTPSCHSHPCYLFSIDFSNDGVRDIVQKLPGTLTFGKVIYLDSKFLMFWQDRKIYFINVSDGEVITSRYLAKVDNFFFAYFSCSGNMVLSHISKFIILIVIYLCNEGVSWEY